LIKKKTENSFFPSKLCFFFNDLVAGNLDWNGEANVDLVVVVIDLPLDVQRELFFLINVLKHDKNERMLSRKKSLTDG
jgi:hypothetical protein